MLVQRVADIRRSYPDPVRQGDPPYPDGCYCVGMAVMLAHGVFPQSETVFPSNAEIAEVLRDLNPALGVPAEDFIGSEQAMTVEDTLAYAFAWRISGANDKEEFEAAWALAERALTYQPGRPGPRDL